MKELYLLNKEGYAFKTDPSVISLDLNKLSANGVQLFISYANFITSWCATTGLSKSEAIGNEYTITENNGVMSLFGTRELSIDFGDDLESFLIDYIE